MKGACKLQDILDTRRREKRKRERKKKKGEDEKKEESTVTFSNADSSEPDESKLFNSDDGIRLVIQSVKMRNKKRS